MKCIVIIAITVLFAGNCCNGQIKLKESENSEKSNLPKTDIKVNKQYDEHGNLIKYDSTYSYSYSNFENDNILGDSIFDNFNRNFNHRFFFSEIPFFDDKFFHDSLFDNDFEKGFFINPFFDPDRMNKLFWDLDSLNGNLFKDSIMPFNKIY